jgi:ESCRT-II complex subunit VPS25
MAMSAASNSPTNNFKFSDFYHFPPFFTLQPTDQTRKQQLDLWLSHVIQYLKYLNKSSINLQQDSKTPLFENQQIQRGLSAEAIKIVADYLVSQGYAVWHNNAANSNMNNSVLYVSWHSFTDWAAIIYNFAQNNSLINTIVTLYELQCGDASKKAEFYNLNETILLQAIKVLQEQNRAAIVPGENIQETGIKFKAV